MLLLRQNSFGDGNSWGHISDRGESGATSILIRCELAYPFTFDPNFYERLAADGSYGQISRDLWLRS